jgi:ABC-2 type transport system ATP-binding protein
MALAEQVGYLGRLHGLTSSRARSATEEWLDRLALADRAGEKVEALSHGNQQRAQLAAALVHDPELLVLDEPLSGLDPAGIDAIIEVLRERARAGCCVLLSSHQLDLLEDLCDSVVIIDHGRRVAAGPVADLAGSGEPRVVVRVEGDPDGAWARRIPGVRVSEFEQGGVRLVLDPSLDSQAILSAATSAGRVTRFELVGRRLSEVFREATR